MLFGMFSDWNERERVDMSMHTLYRELDGELPSMTPATELW